MAEMPFVSSLVQEDLPVWQQCLDTEFLRRMEDGTLDEACFKGYIVEDSLYLREYAKVFAWGMTKARTMETLRNYYSLLGFVQESEDVTRLHYLEQFGLSEADLQALPLRPENRAYVDCMINAAKNGEGEAECIMACLPCMLSYGWIFQKMLDRSPAVRDTLYGPLVQDYAGPGYADACRGSACFRSNSSQRHRIASTGTCHHNQRSVSIGRVLAMAGESGILQSKSGRFQRGPQLADTLTQTKRIHHGITASAARPQKCR